MNLGETEWVEWLDREAEAFNPDVIWIDSVMSCGLQGITNDAAVRANKLFMRLAADYDASVTYSHHHRQSAGNKVTNSDASLGGMQFTGQPDLTMTMANTRKFCASRQPDGSTLTEAGFAFLPDKSGRGAFWTVKEQEMLIARGELVDDVLVLLSLTHAKEEPPLDEQVLAVLGDGPRGNTAIAEALEVNRTSRSLRAVLENLSGRGEIVKTDYKLYERTDQR